MKDTPCHVLVNQYNKNPIDARNILQQLIDSGADLNRQNKDGWTPVHCAIKKVSITALQGIIDVAR
jgi:ankyrin repeat protein